MTSTSKLIRPTVKRDSLRLRSCLHENRLEVVNSFDVRSLFKLELSPSLIIIQTRIIIIRGFIKCAFGRIWRDPSKSAQRAPICLVFDRRLALLTTKRDFSCKSTSQHGGASASDGILATYSCIQVGNLHAVNRQTSLTPFKVKRKKPIEIGGCVSRESQRADLG